MRTFVIGLVLAALLMGAIVLTPRLTRSSAAATAQEARAQAELARRRLHTYSQSLSRLVAHSEADGLARLRAFTDQNKRLLDEAQRGADAASRDGRQDLEAAGAAGVVQLVEASERLGAARGIRAALERERFTARRLAQAIREDAADRDRLAALDVEPALESLRQDLDGVERLAAETRAQRDAAAGEAEGAESRLSSIRSELEQGRAESLSIEERGFKAGDDASFRAYRERYTRLAERLGALQLEEQRLAFGAGGESDVAETLGLEELNRRVAGADAKLERLTLSRDAIMRQMETIERQRTESQAAQQRIEAGIQTQRSALEAVLARLAELHGGAMEQEDQAVRAARSAGQAFNGHRAAIDGWVRAARDLQQAKDPQRLNDRLKLITGDEMMPQLASGALGRAKTLEGRIQVERLIACEAYAKTLADVAKMASVEADPQALLDATPAIREEAIKALSEAGKTYTDLGRKQTPTSWAPMASLATVERLLARVDSANRDSHLAAAREAINGAVTGREQSPYLRELVALRDRLASAAAAGAVGD